MCIVSIVITAYNRCGQLKKVLDGLLEQVKNWLKTMMDCFKQYNCDGVGERVFPIYPDNTPAWIRQEDKNKMAGVVVTYDYREETKRYEKLMDEFIGANYAFKE